MALRATGLALQRLAPQEQTDQVFRGISLAELHEGTGLGRKSVVAAGFVFKQINQRIRSRIMILAEAFGGLLSCTARNEAPAGRGDFDCVLQLANQAAFLPFAGFGRCVGSSFKVAVRHRIADETDRFSLARVNGFAGQHELQRCSRLYKAWKTLCPAEPRMQAELDFREAEARRMVCDTVVAGESHFESAAKADAMNDRNGRAGQGFEAVKRLMSLIDQRPEVFSAGAGQLFNIRTCHEAAFLAGADE